jgi:hypothetical protein
MRSQNIGVPVKKQIKLRTLAFAGVVLHCSATLSASAAGPANIVIQPTNQIGAVFGSAVFSVTASGVLPFSYQWSFNGQAIANATNSALILSPLGYAESGSYSVMVGNAAGTNASSNALLTVSEAIVSPTPYSSYTTNFQGFLLQFTNLMAVSANSDTICALLTTGTVVPFTPYGNPFAPPYDTNVTPPNLNNVISMALGDYANDLVAKSDGTVAVWNFDSPYMTNVPSGLTNVTAVAAGYVGTSYDIALRSDGTVVGWDNTNGPLQMLLSNTVAIAAGRYGVFLALEANGTVFECSNQAAPPVMKLVPGLSNVIAIAADSSSLALQADGTVVGWNGLPSNPLPGVSNVVALATGGLEFLALEANGAVVGSSTPATQFPVALSNVFFITVNPVYGGGIALFNDGSPALTVQPGNQTLTNGGTIWLHARAVGAQPMSYQWLLDGTILPDATNADLTITNAQGYDTGQYCALVSNQLGSASSLVASVTIPIAHTPAQLGVPTLMSDGSLLFSVCTTNGQSLALTNPAGVILQASSNLVDWMMLTNGLTPTNGGALLNDPAAANSPIRFYRLRRQ